MPSLSLEVGEGKRGASSNRLGIKDDVVAVLSRRYEGEVMGSKNMPSLQYL